MLNRYRRCVVWANAEAARTLWPLRVYNVGSEADIAGVVLEADEAHSGEDSEGPSDVDSDVSTIACSVTGEV